MPGFIHADTPNTRIFRRRCLIKGFIAFGVLLICICIAFASIQLNTNARYHVEQLLRENHWDRALTYTDIDHRLFSSTGQLLGVKLYAYPQVSVDKVAVVEMTPNRSIIEVRNMNFDVLHALQKHPDVEQTFRNYQPITHLLSKPLYSLLLMNQPIVRANGKLVIARTNQKAIADITLDAENLGHVQVRLFFYPVTDSFTHDFITDLLQGRISPTELAELPIVKTEITYADKGGLQRYQEYLSTLPTSLTAEVKQANPQLTQFIFQPKSEIKTDSHPFIRKRSGRNRR